jgi:hypothetical protein
VHSFPDSFGRACGEHVELVKPANQGEALTDFLLELPGFLIATDAGGGQRL